MLRRPIDQRPQLREDRLRKRVKSIRDMGIMKLPKKLAKRRETMALTALVELMLMMLRRRDTVAIRAREQRGS